MLLLHIHCPVESNRHLATVTVVLRVQAPRFLKSGHASRHQAGQVGGRVRRRAHGLVPAGQHADAIGAAGEVLLADALDLRPQLLLLQESFLGDQGSLMLGQLLWHGLRVAVLAAAEDAVGVALLLNGSRAGLHALTGPHVGLRCRPRDVKLHGLASRLNRVVMRLRDRIHHFRFRLLRVPFV